MTSVLKMLTEHPPRLGQYFQDRGHSFSPYEPTLSRQITYISVSLIKMQRIFLFELRISEKKRGKDISDTLLSFFFRRIKPDNSAYPTLLSCARGCKLSKHERILSYSIFGNLHRRRFHLSLARKPTYSFSRSCYLGRI